MNKIEPQTKKVKEIKRQLNNLKGCLPGLRHRKRWYVKFDLSLFMKHWIAPSRGPG